MLGFSPFKKHANKFNYIPRYYDPRRRRARRVVPSCTASGATTRRGVPPGKYIRTQRDARAAPRRARGAADRKRIWTMAVGAVLVLLFVYMLFPRLAEGVPPGAAGSCRGGGSARTDSTPTLRW